MLLGVDVSKHQGHVDFESVRRDSTIRWAVVKATEGADYQDPRFRASWDDLLKLDPGTQGADGMVRGVYHFARQDLRATAGRSAGEKEARNLCELLKTAGGYGPGCLPPALDWEKYGGTPARNREWIAGFVHVVSAELGRDPMIYTGPNVWRYTTGDTRDFAHLPLWVVKYAKRAYVDAGSSPPAIPRRGEPWPWTFWQWSGGGNWAYYRDLVGRMPGIQGKGIVDVNRFDGSWEDLLVLAGSGESSEELPRPVVEAPSGAPPGIMAMLDLEDLESDPDAVAIVQGLLMGNGYGPAGLAGSDGLPDGRTGPQTRLALEQFKSEHGLESDAVVDCRTWNLLLTP